MDGSVLVLSVAVLLFLATLLMLRAINGELLTAREPVTWFYASWLLGLVTLALPLFRYHERFTLNSAGFLIATLFAFSVGAVSAAFWARRAETRRRDEMVARQHLTEQSLRLPLVLLLLGLTGSSLLLTNSILGGDLSLVDRLDTENLSDIRATHMTAMRSQIGPLYGIANLCSAIGGVGIAMAFYLRGSSRASVGPALHLFRLAQATLAFNFAIGLIGFGSRMFSLFVVLVAVIALAQGRWAVGDKLFAFRISVRRALMGMLAVGLAVTTLYVAGTEFLERRVQSQDPQALLFRTHRATLAPGVYELTRNDKTAQYFLLSVSYFSTPIATLVYYTDLPEGRAPGPFFGQYNFPAVSRWARRLTFTGDPFAWEMARYYIFKPLADINFGTNVWSTLVRDLMADFTKIGALIFVLGLGFAAQRLHDLQVIRPDVRRAALLVYLRLVIAFAGLVSILFMPQIHWPLYLAVVLVLLRPKPRPVIRRLVGGRARPLGR